MIASPFPRRLGKPLACALLFACALAFLSPGIARAQAAVSASLSPFRLRCEYRVDPLGIDAAAPRLDWIVRAETAGRGLAQTAYQVLVASSPELLAKDQGDLWDTGKVISDQMSQLPYAGKPLATNQRVWWKVRVWDQAGAASAWSPAARWTMGVLAEADWRSAKWIGAPDANQPDDHEAAKAKYETVLLRREFPVKAGLKRATVNVCGLGQYEMTLNGKKVGDELMAPGWTLYNKTCLYDTYDITAALHPGANAAGLFLGNGFYNIHKGRYVKILRSFGPQQAIAVIRLEYADGTAEDVVTDERWKAGSGPITFSSIYGGEDYDARLVQDGWDTPGFRDSAWETPAVTKGPGGALRGLSYAGLPIRAFDVLKPIGKKEFGPAAAVYDLGQNAAIMLRLKIKGAAGSSARITVTEAVDSKGDAKDYLSGGSSYWTYTLRGKGDEEYFSRFYYNGGRYLKAELKAAPDGTLPEIESVEGVTIHADARPVGQFSCSNERFNKIYTITRWAQMSNMVSITTDCPTREKLGWLDQNHFNGPALRYNFDLSALFTKIVNDAADSQHADGLIPTTDPEYSHFEGGYVDSPEFGSTAILVPWQQYQFDGDVGLMGRYYDTMGRFLRYIGGRAKGGIAEFGLGDWYDNQSALGPPKLTPVALTSTAAYYDDARTLGWIAGVLHKPDDVAEYQQLAARIASAFNKKFFNTDKQTYATGSQTSKSLPLFLGIVDPAARAAVLDKMVNDPDVRRQLTTSGEGGLQALIRVLADSGHSDLLYWMYNTDASGYGLQVKLGKTALTEAWNGDNKSPVHHSDDHFMFGQINEWLFTDLAGIQQAPDGQAFRNIVIVPAVVGDLTGVKGSYDSISGKIVSEWKRDGNSLTLHVVIPPNTTATVRVPATDAALVSEGGQRIGQAPGVRFLKMTTDGPPTADYAVGSGDYTFHSTVPPAAELPVLPPEAAPEDQGFTDDFTQGNGNWQEHGGHWKMDAGVYGQTDAHGGAATVKNLQWANATYSYSIRIDDPGRNPQNWAAFVFRVGDPTATIVAGGGYGLFLRGNGEVVLYNGQVLKTIQVGVNNLPRWVKFRVVTRGDEIQVFLNDESSPQIDVHDAAFTAGYAGFQAYDSKASFGPLTITPTPATP